MCAALSDRHVPPSGRPEVVVIVGASSGIGRATARAFARRGGHLVLAGRSACSLQDVVLECKERGGEAVAVPTDVSDERQVRALAEAAVSTFGGIDVWIGCASVFSYGRFEDTPPAVFRQVVETNLFGNVYGARAALRQFRAQGSGTLIMIGSIYSKVTSPYVSPYAASKFGLLGFTGVLRQELKDAKGIQACMVLPSTIDTPIYQHSANYTGKRVHPLPPVVSPDRVARAILGLVERPRPVIVVGQVQRATILMQAVVPRLYDLSVVLVMDILALRRGSVPPSAGTVFEASPESNRLTGGWRSAGWRSAGWGGLAAVATGVLVSLVVRRASRR